MGQVLSFEEEAIARLRERLGVAEEANEDLIAFARGHSDAVASINAAVLSAIEAPSIDALFDIVSRRWPAILGIDHVAVGLIVGDRAFRCDADSLERVEPVFIRRMIERLPAVEVQSVPSGHGLFGIAAAPHVRAQALVRIDGPPPYPEGLLALGQKAEIAVETSHGSALLAFLGQVLAATVRRCVATA